MNEDDWINPVRTHANEGERQSISDAVEVFLRCGGEIQQCGPSDNAGARFTSKRTRAEALSDMKRANYRRVRQ